MNALVVCPHCQRTLRLPEWAAGKAVRCPACRGVIPAVPTEMEEPSPPRALTADPLPRSAAAQARPHLLPEGDEVDDREARPRRRKSIRKRSSNRLLLGLLLGGVLLGVLVMCGGGGAALYFAFNKSIPEAEWQTFTPPGSNCTLVMPGKPTSRPLVINGLTIDKYVLERKRENSIFAFLYLNLDVDPLPPNTLDTMANAERDNLTRTLNARVVSESKISLGNWPGREVQMTPGRGILIVRCYLVKVHGRNRLYMLMAGGDFMKANQGDAAHFFNSFQLDAAAAPVGGMRR